MLCSENGSVATRKGMQSAAHLKLTEALQRSIGRHSENGSVAMCNEAVCSSEVILHCNKQCDVAHI